MRQVVLEACLADGCDPEMRSALRELLARLGLSLAEDASPEQAEVVAYVRVEAAGRGARVLVSGKRGQSPPPRREVVPAATRALFRETLAHVIFAAVEALAAQPSQAPAAPATATQTRASAPEQTSDSILTPEALPAAHASSSGSGDELERRPAPASAAADASRSAEPGPATAHASPPPALSLGARGAGVFVAAGRFGARLSGLAALSWHVRLTPEVALEAGCTLPVHVERRSVRARLVIAPVRGWLRIEPYRAASWAVRTMLGGGFDLVSMAPAGSPDHFETEPATRRLHPMFSAAAGLRRTVAAKLALTVDLGLDVDGAPVAWELHAEAGRPIAFFETARWRPYVALGLDWMRADRSSRSGRP